MHNIIGSDVDFDKWNFAVTDKINLKLAGQFSYRIDIGGFLNNKNVFTRARPMSFLICVSRLICDKTFLCENLLTNGQKF